MSEIELLIYFLVGSLELHKDSKLLSIKVGLILKCCLSGPATNKLASLRMFLKFQHDTDQILDYIKKLLLLFICNNKSP